MSGLWKIPAVLLLLYGAWVALIFFGQRAILYPGAAQREAPAHPPGVPRMEMLGIETPAGTVEAWFLPAAPGPRPAPAVIFLHGNGELIDDWAWGVEGLQRRGLAVLLVEYPGYGRSAGRPSQAAITQAVVAAYDSLVARPDVNPARVIAYGRSLGGGAAAQLAARRPIAALVLVSSFTSVRDFARPYLVPPAVVRDPFDTRRVLGEYEGAVLVVHGRRDEMIPYRHGVELAGAAPRGRLVSHDVGHNDCPPDLEAHWAEVVRLLGAGAPRDPAAH